MILRNCLVCGAPLEEGERCGCQDRAEKNGGNEMQCIRSYDTPCVACGECTGKDRGEPGVICAECGRQIRLGESAFVTDSGFETQFICTECAKKHIRRVVTADVW